MKALIRFIVWIFRVHGIKEGDVMHERCPLCAGFRQWTAWWCGGFKVRGFWRMPYELPKEFF